MDDATKPSDCTFAADPTTPVGTPMWDKPRTVVVSCIVGETGHSLSDVNMISQQGGMVQFFKVGSDIPCLLVPHHNLGSIFIKDA